MRWHVHPEDTGAKQNLLHAFWPIGVLAGTLTIGELLTRGVDWRTVFVGLAVVVPGVSLIYPLTTRAPSALPRGLLACPGDPSTTQVLDPGLCPGVEIVAGAARKRYGVITRLRLRPIVDLGFWNRFPNLTR